MQECKNVEMYKFKKVGMQESYYYSHDENYDENYGQY